MNFIPITSKSVEFHGHTEFPTMAKVSSFDITATDLSTKCFQNYDPEVAHSQPNESSLSGDTSKLIKNKNSKSGNKKSFVWKYFAHPKTVDGNEDRSRTECLECKSQLAFNASGTTTTMLNHLKSRHSKIAETEEWRKIKTNSINIFNGENGFSMPVNNESPTETLSPAASFDFQKPSNSSPECKTSEVNVHSQFPNNCLDQGQLMCLTKLLPRQMMVTNMETNMTTTMNNGHISMSQGETNDNEYNTSYNNGSSSTSGYYSVSRSTMKRKRKRPTSMQNENQLSLNSSNCQFNQMNTEKSSSSDLSSNQSIGATSHTSTFINNLLNHSFLSNDSCNMIYSDNNNNNTSSPSFVPMKPFSGFTVPGSPNSSLASNLGITESEKTIVYWLIKDQRPYSILEETGIKALFSTLMPSVAIPSESRLKNHILPSIYWSLKTEILNDFSAELGAAFSIELWDMSTNGCVYASVKLNYYSCRDSKLRSKMFVTKEINAKYLCSDLLLSCCNEIGIDFKKLQFLPVVMNNPESMSDELANVGEIEQNKKFVIIPCLINSLQDVAKVGFQEPGVVRLLEKCRALKELAGAYNLQLDNDSGTATNQFVTSKCSSDKFELMNWVYLNLDEIVEKLDCFNLNRFSKDDEIFLKQLTPLLEHIYQTLNLIEQHRLFFSASMIKSIILTMNKSPFQPKNDDHQGVIQFKMAVKNRLSKIYPPTGPIHEILWIATVLDPRFKKCQDSEEADMLQELRNQMVNANEYVYSSENGHGIPNSIKRENLHSIFGDDCLSQEPRSELDQYLNEHKLDIEKNPIKWWHDNSSRFPNLSKHALKYLCIPLANRHGLESPETDSVLYDRRKDIVPDEIDHYLFLNHNWR